MMAPDNIEQTECNEERAVTDNSLINAPINRLKLNRPIHAVDPTDRQTVATSFS